MRRIRRKRISEPARAYLRGCTLRVRRSGDTKELQKREVKRLDDKRTNQRKAARNEIREVLESMAHGRECCMYCEDNEGTHIEHFYPKNDFPELAFTWRNYLLACEACNSNHKRTQFPMRDGKPLLLDPCGTEEPFEHLAFSPSTGEFFGTTERGQQSIDVFGLYRTRLTVGRKNCWTTLMALIPIYAQAKREQDEAWAGELEQAIRDSSFSCVLYQLLELAKLDSARSSMREECLTALHECPEIAEWLT